MCRRVLLSTSVAAALLAFPLRFSAASPPAVTPILVELFTSEGCSSCPPADALLQTLVDTQPIAGVQVIALGHHVDYWDRLGWRDRFSSSASTARQERYAQIFNLDSIYTPEMVVDGHDEFVGSDAGAARRTIANAAASAHALVTLALESAPNDRVAAAVTVSNLPKLSRGDRADVVLATTESRLRSDVRGGENRGRVLTHAPVVRQTTTIGEATAGTLRGEVAMGAGWQRDRVAIVAFIQERSSRRVLGAASAALPSARP
jgi:hypothetical protein